MNRAWPFAAVSLFCLLAALPLDAQKGVSSLRDANASNRVSSEDMHAAARRAIGPEMPVCDVVLLPIRGRRTPKLLASIDVSGRDFCNELVRIRLGTTPAVLQSIRAWIVEHPSDILRDLDRDGFPELLVPVDFSPYEGAQACVATAPIVYSCASGTCVDARRRYVDFYRHLAEELEGALLTEITLRETMGSADDDWRLPCVIMRRDKVRRMAGLDRLAGFDVAMKWMSAGDPYLRKKAVAIFSDIDTDAARQELAKLAKDRDPTVAGYAEICIAGRPAR